MKIIASLTAIGLLSLTIASCSSAPRIDGSSKAAFERTHAAVIASLSPGDRMRLSLAEIVFLSRKDCLSTKPIPDQPWLDKMLGGQADPSSCRRELQGLTFRDIMNRAYPKVEQNSAPSGG